jgi:hypothetical protein
MTPGRAAPRSEAAKMMKIEAMERDTLYAGGAPPEQPSSAEGASRGDQGVMDVRERFY